MMKNRLRFSRKAYDKYMRTVKDNDGISKEQAELKMTRNMMLAVANERSKTSTHYKYGGLHFIVSNNQIVWIQNHCAVEKGWKRNNRLYIKLNKELGIEDDTTLLQLYKKDLTIRFNRKFKGVKMKMNKLITA